ncbi:MAG: hypothetical protein L0Z70_14730 [Chloroflexi bacterium]|nr:hypothetical protein [Chloroflexota bacterium]
MPHYSAPVWALLALTAFLIGLSKGWLGGLLGSLATPLVALALPAVWLGVRLARRIPKKTYEGVILALMALSALVLIIP